MQSWRLTSAALLLCAAGTLWTSQGCDTAGGDGVSSCAGSFTGTYTGSEEGLVSATLTPEGMLEATFVRSGTGPDRDLTGGMVDAMGMVTTSTGSYQATGSFNLDDCTATGNWTRDMDSGTWTLNKF